MKEQVAVKETVTITLNGQPVPETKGPQND